MTRADAWGSAVSAWETYLRATPRYTAVADEAIRRAMESAA